jgi:hypothetical protein
MTTGIDLRALADRETGAPDPDPNRDTAFDADEGDRAIEAAIEARRPPALPAPWAMSIRELDSWHDHYAARDGSVLVLSNDERRHRAEIDRNIFLRHEARRHSCYS